MYYKIVLSAVALLLLLSLSPKQDVTANQKQINVKINNQLVPFDEPPRIVNNRVLVPLRGVFENLGYQVVWEHAGQNIQITKGNKHVKLTVNSHNGFVNNQSRILDQPPIISNERTLIPLRFVSEAIGSQVNWDAATRQVSISYPSTGNQQIQHGAIQELNFIYQNKLLLDRILNYERQFSMNGYHGNIEARLPYQFYLGKIPILISAPHTTEHIREGHTKKADIYTGSLALLLHELTDVHVIYSTKISDDPNFVEGGVYKEALRKLIQDHNILYVIDLHGSAINERFDIDLGTINGLSIDLQKIQAIQRTFKKNDINKVTINDTFAGTHPGTIVNFTSQQLQKEAIQIEISKLYRNPREDIDSYYLILKSLIEIVELLK